MGEDLTNVKISVWNDSRQKYYGHSMSSYINIKKWSEHYRLTFKIISVKQRKYTHIESYSPRLTNIHKYLQNYRGVPWLYINVFDGNSVSMVIHNHKTTWQNNPEHLHLFHFVVTVPLFRPEVFQFMTSYRFQLTQH